MIISVERLGKEDKAEGWFLINGIVRGRFVEVDGTLRSEVQYDADEISEQEAQDLMKELYEETINFHKSL